MPTSLALYLNSANPDQRWRTLDRAIFANLDDLRQGCTSLSEDEQLRVRIRWARQNDDHRVYDPQCPLWGCVHPLWTGPRDFTLHDLGIQALTRNLGTVPATASMLSSQSIKSFVEGIDTSASPASIVFGGHGDGPYAVVAMFGEADAVASDDSPSWLTPAELTRGLSEAGFGPDRRFQVIGFDNCQQASLELAIELRDFALYLVAAQLNVPGIGWSYRDWPALALHGADAPQLAQAMVDSYRARYDSARYPSQTLTSIKLSPMKEIGSALHGFCDRALSLPDASELRRLRSIRTSLPTMPMSQVAKVDAFALFDAFAQDPGADAAMRANAASICAGIAAATQGSWIPPSVASAYSAHGLSIVFPAASSDVSDVLQSQYFDADANLATFRATRWPELLSAIVALQ